MTKQSLASLALLAVIVLTILLALYDLQPPSPLPASADNARFSAERALSDIREIAAQPHPVGSAEHARVLQYLLARMRELGLDPTIQKTTSAITFDVTRSAEVHNVIATIRGSSNSKAVLLAAHYDSNPFAPGAADDGYAVASILETIRALKSHPPLKNDLIILLTDGEEMGLNGAKAFVRESPLADEIGFVMNFEGRGSSGPSIMFETTDENGWVVREFRNAVSSGVAYSLTYDLYKLLPNNTDFTFFKKSIPSGLNFAHIGSVKNYHSAKDDIHRLDLRTVQHHGSTMLASVLHFGNLDLTSVRAPDVVYFTFLFPRFVVYPKSWTLPLTIAATLFFVAVLLLGFKKAQLRIFRLLLSFLIFLLRVGIAAAVTFFLWKKLGPLQPEFGYFYLNTVYHGDLFLGGFLALGVTVALLFHHTFSRKLGALNLACGALFLWLIVLWASVIYLPGGNYLFLWPFLFTLAAITFAIMRSDQTSRSLTTIVVPAFCSLPGIYLFSQLLFLLYEAMTLLIIGGIVGLAVLLLATLQLHLTIVTERKPWLLPLLSILAALLFIGNGVRFREPDERYPKPNSVFYAFDADSGRAVWGTWDSVLDDWTTQFFSASPDTTPVAQFFPSTSRRILSGPAPVTPLQGPQIDLINDVKLDSVRTLRMRIRSSRPSYTASLSAEPGRKVWDVRINGKAAIDSVHMIFANPMKENAPWTVFYSGDLQNGFEVELKTTASKPFVLRVVDRSKGFHEMISRAVTPRPPSMMPRPYYVSDETLVGKTWRL